MKLIEALRLLNRAASYTDEFRLFLACGFSPLHLQTFFAAEAQLIMAQRRVSLLVGAYDDLAGAMDKLVASEVDAGCVVIEWPDLDPRLGLRRLSAWTHRDYADILHFARESANRLADKISKAARGLPLSVCLPTLPIPPFAHTRVSNISTLQAELQLLVATMTANLGRDTRIRLANPQRIDEASSYPRFNLESYATTGFPYTLSHASAVARVLVDALLSNPGPKGIITDLDNTLWNGLIGEVGVDGVHWDVDHASLPHGLYQQLLHCLAQEGVMIGVASKNSPELIKETFRRRSDLLLAEDDVFPFDVNWGAK